MLLHSLLLILSSVWQAFSQDSDCPFTFVESIKSARWECAKAHADEAQSIGQDLRNIFDMESRGIQKELTALKKYLESHLPMNNINPAYQWAQSPDEVFISVKFAHKLDTPGTLNVEPKNVSLSNSTLYMLASDGRKNFHLELELLKEIVPEESSWSLASVGRMTFTLRKRTAPSNWARLLKDKLKKAPNQHFWWEMHERYAAALNSISTEDKPPAEKNETATAGVTEDQSNAAATSTPEAEPKAPSPQEMERKRLQKEYKAAVQLAEAEGRRRKTEIDNQAKKQKESVDQETEVKKKELLDKYQQDIQALKDNARPPSSDSVAKEL